MTYIKPIETEFNGYRFRSRLEARWAVFFDALNIQYEYELEGFEFGDGQRYLPDFWLPHIKLWVEIKGELTWLQKTHKWGTYYYSPELELMEKFRDAQEWPTSCIVGTPGKERIYFYGWDVTDSSGGNYQDDDSFWVFSNGIITLNVNPGRNDRTFLSDNLMGEYMPQFEYSRDHGYSLDPIKIAVIRARQARFEYGESG